MPIAKKWSNFNKIYPLLKINFRLSKSNDKVDFLFLLCHLPLNLKWIRNYFIYNNN